MTAGIDVRKRAQPAARGVVRPDHLELRELEDSQVVAAYLAGRGRAFDEIVDRYQKRLLNFVHRTIGDRERAEDLVQEVFIRVHRHLHRFDQTKKFSTWIYTIASNLSKNELRNRSRSPLVLFQTIKRNWDADHRPLQFEDKHYRPEDLFHRRYLREAVDWAVAQLPEHHRVVFVLRELEGKTYEEIAEITHCNLGTVKSRLNRARNRFAQIVGPLLD
jgi:RNA polymerase sigma-70 factor (ECF subfamily)